MEKEIFFKIKPSINWRKEGGVFMLLNPQDKHLYFFDKNISSSVSNEGIINQTINNKSLLDSLLKRKIITKMPGPKTSKDFQDKEFSSPLNVTIQVTDKCNLKCIYCHRDSKNTDTMYFPKFEKVIKELHNLNVFNINISGGEPLLIPQIVKMVSTINRLGMKVTMSTNGTLLTNDLVRKLRLAGLKQVQISIDSENPEIHNKMRGLKDAFKTTTSNVVFLKKEHLPFAIVTTLLNQSPEEYGKIIDLSYNLGAFAHKTNTFIPSGACTIKDISNLSVFKFVKDFIKIWERKKAQYKGKMLLSAETMFAIQMGIDCISPSDIPTIIDCGCPAGFLTCAINQKGDILPCPFFSGLILGNVFEDSFSNVWNNAKAKEFRNRNKIDICGECEYKQNCGGCRARSFGIFGKCGQTDPYCFKNQ